MNSKTLFMFTFCGRTHLDVALKWFYIIIAHAVDVSVGLVKFWTFCSNVSNTYFKKFYSQIIINNKYINYMR